MGQRGTLQVHGIPFKTEQQTVGDYLKNYFDNYVNDSWDLDFDSEGVLALRNLSDALNKKLYQEYILPRIEQESEAIPTEAIQKARAQIGRDVLHSGEQRHFFI